jgi:hypothetical protein
MEQHDLFGFLPCKWDIKFDGGLVSPIVDCEQVENWISESTHEDGFLYPPMKRTMKVDSLTMEHLEEVPKTKRPALLHRIPASHEIVLFDAPDTQESFRKGPGGFVIYLLSYILCTRLQFHDWGFDGRVPIESTHNIFITKPIIEDFLSHSYNTWLSWDQQSKIMFTNLLYMHSRSPSYELDWERFTIEYMVFDCCFKLAKNLNIINLKNKKIGHRERMKIICDKFKIPYEQDIVNDIVELRNTLFHEALWDYSKPCFSLRFSKYNQLYDYHLRRLNKRIIPYLLGYYTPYINTGWHYLGTFIFDKPK